MNTQREPHSTLSRRAGRRNLARQTAFADPPDRTRSDGRGTLRESAVKRYCTRLKMLQEARVWGPKCVERRAKGNEEFDEQGWYASSHLGVARHHHASRGSSRCSTSAAPSRRLSCVPSAAAVSSCARRAVRPAAHWRGRANTCCRPPVPHLRRTAAAGGSPCAPI